MVYNNFSEKYKKTLITAENRIKEIGFKELKTEDIFLEILRDPEEELKEIFSLYGINERLILEVMQK